MFMSKPKPIDHRDFRVAADDLEERGAPPHVVQYLRRSEAVYALESPFIKLTTLNDIKFFYAATMEMLAESTVLPDSSDERVGVEAAVLAKTSEIWQAAIAHRALLILE